MMSTAAVKKPAKKTTAKKTTKKAQKAQKTLVVVESPAKAKTIEKYLGRNFVVRASMGHLRDLPKSQFGIDVENDFEPKYINIRGKGDLIKNLKKDEGVNEIQYILLGAVGRGKSSTYDKIVKSVCS